MKYLYGAAIDGIQQYIFQTGKLKEIVGGSELVEQICKQKFQDILGNDFNPQNAIVQAAGKITYVFDNLDVCKKFVAIFSKAIKEMTPDIQLTQAIVKLDDGNLSKEKLLKLEEKLDAQKNKKIGIHGLGLMISERSRRTGGTGVERQVEKTGEKAVVRDRNQKIKWKYSKKTSLASKMLQGKLAANDELFKFPTDIERISPKNKKFGLAVIHADGNNLGQTIENIYQHIEKDHSHQMGAIVHEFSNLLDESTKNAATTALNHILTLYPSLDESKLDNEKLRNNFLPLRPIILGGDDLSLIIRDDLAIDFISEFLKAFQVNTKNNFTALVEQYGLSMLENGLTACAGIAFVKPNYPFHYGVHLSEKLATYSKKSSKAIAKKNNRKLAPSCLTFHKVQSSFIENYKEIIKRELTAGDVGFNYGPYFIEEQKDYATVQQLQDWIATLNTPDAPKSGLRKWLTDLHHNKGAADQLMKRIRNLNGRYLETLDLLYPTRKRIIGKTETGEDDVQDVTHIFDMLTLASIENH